MDLSKFGYLLSQEDMIWFSKDRSDVFKYTDGDSIESNIFDSLRKTSDVSVDSVELSSKITDWPTLYHFSQSRSNLLRSVENHIGKYVLEIGAGCGALTRFLGEKGCEVLAVEGSYQRARIARERCRSLDNITILSENIENINIDQKFDTIILVGVLEYARLYFRSNALDNHADPVDELIKFTKSFLKDDGCLLIGIENQLGLKYFSGYPEDHFDIPFYGIENKYSSNSIVTFGRKYLADKIKNSGYIFQLWTYPFPDYKLPVAVISESLVNSDELVYFSDLIMTSSENYRSDQGKGNFSIRRAWDPVIKNSLLGHLANSFLIVASAQEIKKDGFLACHFGGTRLPPYRKIVTFTRTDDKINVNRRRINPQHASQEDPDVTLFEYDTIFVDGYSWYNIIDQKIRSKGWIQSEFNKWAHVWLVELLSTINGNKIPFGNLDQFTVDGKYFDYIPKNLIVGSDGVFNFIDKEFIINSKLNIGYIYFRGLIDTLLSLEFEDFNINSGTCMLLEIVVSACINSGINLSYAQCESYWESETRYQKIISGNKTMDYEELCNYKLGQKKENDYAKPSYGNIINNEDSMKKIEDVYNYFSEIKTDLLNSIKLLQDFENRFLKELNSELVDFDVNWYLNKYNDVKQSGMNPYIHYLRHGIHEGRKKHV